jgi:hypothetical protein
MKSLFYTRISVFLALLFISGLAQAAAFFDNLTVNSTTTNLTVGQNAAVNINWTTFVSSDNNVTGNIVATSSGGVYGNGLGNVRTTLRFDYGQANGLTSSPHVFNEVILIPSSLIDQAVNLGLTSITYTRTFSLVEGTIPSGTQQATVTFNIVQPTTPTTPAPSSLTNPSVSTLDLNRLSLTFNDNSIVKLVKPKTYLNAVAQISYTGTGLLDAVWKIATPASTQGAQDAAQLIYIPLRTVRQYLGAGGRVILQSPKLPTDMPGNYVVTLTINPAAQTNINFNQPVILRYAVGVDGEELRARKQPPINVASPRDKALLDENTRFKWQPVAGARAYQLELYLPDRRRPMSSELSEQGYDESSIADQAPASGLLVPGKRTSLSLGELSKQHLRHGETYLWRIIAIGQDGSIISSSPIREIRIP